VGGIAESNLAEGQEERCMAPTTFVRSLRGLSLRQSCIPMDTQNRPQRFVLVADVLKAAGRPSLVVLEGWAALICH